MNIPRAGETPRENAWLGSAANAENTCQREREGRYQTEVISIVHAPSAVTSR